MSDDKQNEVLTGYEQLKRRNRRRLVMASGLVAVSTVLLGVALTSGPENKQDENAQAVAVQQKNTAAETPNAADATVLEPSAQEDLDAAAEAVKKADAEVADKPQEMGAQAENVETLSPAQPSQPEDLGPPLVLINDTLSDSDIKGLEESEKIQKADAAKREAAERRAEERRRQREEQRAARKAQQLQAQEAAEREANAAARKRALQEAKAERAERAASAERNRLAQLGKAEKAAAERKAAKAKEEAVKKAADKAKADALVKEKAKAETAKAEAAKKAAAVKEAEAKAVKAKTETAKADKANIAERSSEKAKPKTIEAKPGKKAAIQAGYAEKERALSLQRKMKAEGINATITEVMTDKGKVYRVKSGAYKSTQEAERDLNKLRVHGIAGQVTHE